ncbi:MAG TPA: HEAT repeat domain-containing protein [Solirubrobacterales bacterium]|jgi:HEAT repeat protein|nr:HEAT repeat domain-containing protein [Solirubrobacterales bacterium]
MPDEVHARVRDLLDHDAVPQVRREAARALGVVGDGTLDRVEPLVKALDDPNDGVRRTATLALGRIRDPRSADALVAILGSHPELWEEASAALATAGDAELLPRLVSLLDSDSSHVRCGALRVIAAVVSKPAPREQREPLFAYQDEEGHRHPLF